MGRSPRTIKTYAQCVRQFLHYCRKDLKYVTKNDVISYLDRFVEKGSAGNTINVHLNALKFFFEKVLKKRLTVNIGYSKTPKQLPEFLTQEETNRLIETISNKKHSLMVKLLYSAGMRVSELVSLKTKDLELNYNYGWIRRGKGNKDRLFVIAEKLKTELIAWVAENELNPNDWLFQGQGNRHISTQTIQLIIKKATKRAKISKNVHPHTLRHSFATHLIQNGYAVTEVQPLLGHNSINTTMIYTHLASPRMLNVKSPYDCLRGDSNQ